MAVHVALLYSVVLGAGRRVGMADLRALAADLGFARPRTLVATGNLVIETDEADARAVEARLEPAFAARFGRGIDIIVRRADGFRRLAAGNPFLEQGEARPATVHVRVMRHPLGERALDGLARFCAAEEAMAIVGGDLWLHLPHGAGRSRLAAAATPARLGVGTFRNWNTARRLAAMLDG